MLVSRLGGKRFILYSVPLSVSCLTFKMQRNMPIKRKENSGFEAILDLYIQRVRKGLLEVYGITVFGLRFLRYVFVPPYELGQVRKHLDELGAKSLPLLTVVGLIMGLILALQSQVPPRYRS